MKIYGKNTRKHRKALLCLALLATMSMIPAMEAAAGSFQSAGMNVASIPNGVYSGTVYEWRNDDTVAQSLPAGCNPSTAPIAVLFHGGTGIDAGNQALIEHMTTLAQRLSTACVRMVSVQGNTPYTANAPANSTSATSVPNQAATNIAFALAQIMSAPAYKNASNVIYLGGSMSGLLGGVMLRNQYSNYTNDGVAYWSKLDRFVMAGPPGGNLYNACQHAAGYTYTAPDISNLFTGRTCQSFVAYFNATTGSLVQPFNSAEIAILRSKVRIHMLVGTNDDLWGYGKPDKPNCNSQAIPSHCWTGPQGVEDYLTMSGFSATTYRDTNAISPNSQPITFTQLIGAGHNNVWDYNTPVEMGICKLISRDFPGTNANRCDSATYSPGPIRGVIDSVQSSTIHGWACAAGSPHSITVHVYAGGAAGSGTLVGGYKAYSTSEPAVANACGSTGTAYRFHIALPLSVRQQFGGQRIYIHGIHPTGAYTNDLLANPGVFFIPAP